MHTEDCSIIYQGFTPSGIIKNSLIVKFKSILLDAPCSYRLKNRNKLKAIISNKDQCYQAVVWVSTCNQRFFAKAINGNLRLVVESIEKQLQRQFDKWKSKGSKQEKSVYLNTLSKYQPAEAEPDSAA